MLQVSGRGWFDFYLRLVRKRNHGNEWLRAILRPYEHFNIVIVDAGLCLLVRIAAVRGGTILQQFSREVMGQYEMHNLECKDGIWSAKFPFSVPIERSVSAADNQSELRANINYIGQIEGLVEQGRMTPDTAQQYVQQALAAIEYINAAH